MRDQISNTDERWLPVLGYESRYWVSDLGNVRSIRGVMRLDLSRAYPRVELTRGHGDARKVCVHRIVAEAFIGLIGEAMEVNHKNGIKLDCHIANLEIVTASYNQWHATHILGKRRHIRGSAHGASKLAESDIPKIRAMGASGMKSSQIGKLFGVRGETIGKICRGERWAHV